MVVYAPAQIISAPAQLITAPAQPPATGVVEYAAFLKHPMIRKVMKNLHKWSLDVCADGPVNFKSPY